MLSDVVGPAGHIYGIENTKWDDGTNAKVAAAVPDHNVTMQDGQFGDVRLPEKVDLFWITQNYHDLHIAKYDPVAIAAFNKDVFDALKPGGTYFILDHQANPGTDEAQIAKLHRIEKAQVIREVEAAGFKLVRRRRRAAPRRRRSHEDDLRQVDSGPHRPVHAEVRETLIVVMERIALALCVLLATPAYANACTPPAKAMARTELFFGAGRVNDNQWKRFLRARGDATLPRWSHCHRGLRPVEVA